VVPGDSTQAGKPGERIESTEAAQPASNDTVSAADSTRIRPPEDSTELHGNVTSDSTPNVAAEAGVAPAAGDTAQPMARDTSTVLAQADTATRETQPADTSAQVTQSDSSQVSSDTASLSVAVDTTSQTPDTMAQASADSSTLHAQADTSTQVGDTTAQAADTSAQVAVGATVDTTAPIRPTEDSTKILAKSDTLPSDRDRIRPPEDSTELHGQVNANEEKVKADQAPAGAAPVEATGSMATGADAVALMTRQGDRCKVKDPETSHEVQWDFAASPATLNPCGTGTMTLPRIQTEEK
jgi:hypothetical protein